MKITLRILIKNIFLKKKKKKKKKKEIVIDRTKKVKFGLKNVVKLKWMNDFSNYLAKYSLKKNNIITYYEIFPG